jgi:hypothetical protein
MGNNRHAADFYNGLGGPQFSDADWRPGWIRRLQELSGDAQHEVSLAP